MTPLQFEARHGEDWALLEQHVARYEAGRRKRGKEPLPDGEAFAARYRRVCEHLSLARERSYPTQLIDRLQRVAADAHQLIYRQGATFSTRQFTAFLRHGFPQCVHRHRYYVLLSGVLFFVPLFVTCWLVYLRPDLILSVVDSNSAQQMEYMYSPENHSIGSERDASSDWVMFGHYIRNNVGIAFRCFAGGLFLGIGSILLIMYNGAVIGSVAGFLTARGLGDTFWSFVATHSSFELLAIVLSGAAGMRLGHSLLAPGRLTRRASLVQATREATPLIYGFTVLLLMAAAVEAFWSSSRWIPDALKYAVAAACWIGLLGYLFLQGRRAR